MKKTITLSTWQVTTRAFIGLILLGLVAACQPSGSSSDNGQLQVVTTTTMITDVVQQIGGKAIQVNGLMGAGVDPHLYKASEGDVNQLFNADLVVYNGLHLEGKLEDIFEKMRQRNRRVVAVADTISKDSLLASADFASNYDPHIWFDMDLWKQAAEYIMQQLVAADPENAETFQQNWIRYQAHLDSIQAQVQAKINELPQEQRILITAHDAFHYFGEAYNFQVKGLQGISTASEAGVQDVQALAQFIVDEQVKAIFVESSVPRRNIEALQQAVKSKGFEVAIGGELFSDACGNPNTPEGTYTGMFWHNVHTIVEALK